MSAIWKFPLFATDIQEVALPRDARVLAVQVQHGQPQLWALVDPDAPIEARAFAVVGTGHPMPEPVGDYRGTFQLPDLGLVFHVFEAPASRPERDTMSARKRANALSDLYAI